MSEAICNCGHAAESHERRVGCLSGTCDCKRTPGEIYRDAITALRAENDKRILQLMDEIEMRLGVNEDRWGELRGILDGTKVMR